MDEQEQRYCVLEEFRFVNIFEEKQQSWLLGFFTLSNNDNYVYEFKYTDTVHVYQNTTTQQMSCIKWIEEDELQNYEFAAKISKRTIPAEVFSLQKVTLFYKYNFDYLLCMRKGGRIDCRNMPLDIACTQLLEGIIDYHANNFLHMDIKPSNVIEYQQNLYFVDFGLSIPFLHEENGIAYDENNDPLQQFTGTTGFWAPEVYNGENYGTKADCYSCGVTILCFVEYYSRIHADFTISKNVTLDNVIEFFKTIEHDPSLFKYLPIVIGLIREDPSQRISAKDALEMLTNCNFTKFKYTAEEMKVLQEMHVQLVSKENIPTKNLPIEIIERSFKNVLPRKRNRKIVERNVSTLYANFKKQKNEKRNSRRKYASKVLSKIKTIV